MPRTRSTQQSCSMSFSPGKRGDPFNSSPRMQPTALQTQTQQLSIIKPTCIPYSSFHTSFIPSQWTHTPAPLTRDTHIVEGPLKQPRHCISKDTEPITVKISRLEPRTQPIPLWQLSKPLCSEQLRLLRVSHSQHTQPILTTPKSATGRQWDDTT